MSTPYRIGRWSLFPLMWATLVLISSAGGCMPAQPLPLPPATPIPSQMPPTSTPLPSPTPTLPIPSTPTLVPASQDFVANREHGQQLFNSLGCAGCHGPQGEGLIGPTIAQTRLPLARVIRQYRAPYEKMPRFGPEQVSDRDIADIYAYLQTLPEPAVRVPSVLATVEEKAGIGTLAGTIWYRGTRQPATDEQIYIVPATVLPDGSLQLNYLLHLPASHTDEQGHFEMADVEAQLYAMFYSRQEEPVRDEQGNILVVNVLPGEVTTVSGFIPPP